MHKAIWAVPSAFPLELLSFLQGVFAVHFGGGVLRGWRLLVRIGWRSA
jgi:hypothetical protein